MRLVDHLQTRYVHGNYKYAVAQLLEELEKNGEPLDITGARMHPMIARMIEDKIGKITIISNEEQYDKVLKNNLKYLTEKKDEVIPELKIREDPMDTIADFNNIKSNKICISTPAIPSRCNQAIILMGANPKIEWYLSTGAESILAIVKRFTKSEDKIYQWVAYTAESGVYVYDKQPKNLTEQSLYFQNPTVYPNVFDSTFSIKNAEWSELFTSCKNSLTSVTVKEARIMDYIDLNEEDK